MTLNAKMTSPPSVRLLHGGLTFTGSEELSKQLKFPGRIVSSQLLSQEAFVSAFSTTLSHETMRRKREVGNATELNIIHYLDLIGSKGWKKIQMWPISSF